MNNPLAKALNIMRNDPFSIGKTAALGLLLAILPACAIPKIDEADAGAPLPRSFTPEQVNSPQGAKNSAQMGWREFFQDEQLAQLIEQALVGNQELKILAQEVRIANNDIEVRKGEYLPFVNLGAGAGIEKSSANTRNGVVEENHDIHGRAFPEPLPDFMVSAKISWEVDIWNKLHNAQKAAALRYLGTQAGQNYVVTRLISEVAEKYYELLALDSRMEILDQTIQIQGRAMDFSKAVKDAGRGTELAIQRFQAEIQKNMSEKLLVKQEMVECENRINFLLGRFPQPIARKSAPFEDIKLHPLDAGMPSELLQNRSDIREAELEMEAAGLDVKVAKARFYPKLDLTAGVGYQAFNARYLLTAPESLIYNAAGELVMPVINRRAIEADYLNANARQIQSVYRYQQTVLRAYVEVSNQLSKVSNYEKSLAFKKAQLNALDASVDSATKLFQNARAEYIEVLFAQRERMESRVALIDVKKQYFLAIVATYQALGGGGKIENQDNGKVQKDGNEKAPSMHKAKPQENPQEKSQRQER